MNLLNLGVNIKPQEEIERWVDWADIIVTASADHNLNQKVAEISGNKSLNRADEPNKGNMIVPSSFFIGIYKYQYLPEVRAHSCQRS